MNVFARIGRVFLLVVLGFAGGVSLVATADAPGASAGIKPPESADLVLANREIFTMRATILGVPPVERARIVRDGIRLFVDYGGPLEVTTAPLTDGVAVLIDDRVVFRVLDGDVPPDTGETPQSVAARAVANLTVALEEMREARNARQLLPAVGYALLATVVLAVLLWLLFRSYGWVAQRTHASIARRLQGVTPRWTGRVLGEAGLTGLFKLPAKLLALVTGVFLVYEWLAFVLRRFPYTRPWGEALLDNLLGTLGAMGSAALRAVPGLLFVALIFFATRAVTRAVRAFFQGVHAGHIKVGLVDETTARPTGQLLITGIWLLALVAAYPYIPGSDSEAFKGIGVFVGLMMSIGASGVVNQAVSGMMLMYTRALKPGEFVKIGDTEGTVTSVGFVTTRIETLRHEEVSIPNALVVGSVTRNYSRLAAEGGVWLGTQVTIGYDTPWRQVHALLKLAAERTGGIEKEPPPRVLQTALQDFYVEYTLLVNVADPSRRAATLDVLHANIQDAFNEFGVQIMSPNYEADPERPKVVPREKWFEPPAPR
jgi:small-conductance mechanosensitive channel